MNLIQQFIHSLWDFRSYPALAKTRGGKSFLYIFLLFTLSFAIFSVKVGVESNQMIDTIQTVMQNDVPDFRLEGGQFSFDGPQPYIVQEDAFTFIIDTTGETQLEDLAYVLNGLFITDTELIAINSGRTEITSFQSIPIDLTKDQIVNFMPSLLALVYIFLAIWYVFAFGAKLLGILILALITMIATALFRQNLTFVNQWNIAIYASTLPIVLKSLHSLANAPLTGFFFLIYWSIAITYVFLGVYALSKENGAAPDTDSIDLQAE